MVWVVDVLENDKRSRQASRGGSGSWPLARQNNLLMALYNNKSSPLPSSIISVSFAYCYFSHSPIVCPLYAAVIAIAESRSFSTAIGRRLVRLAKVDSTRRRHLTAMEADLAFWDTDPVPSLSHIGSDRKTNTCHSSSDRPPADDERYGAGRRIHRHAAKAE